MSQSHTPDPTADHLRKLWLFNIDHQDTCALKRKTGAACSCEMYAATEEFEKLVSKLLEWKIAVVDAAVVDWVYVAEHDENPRKAINDLLCWATKMALDPAISKEAADWRKQNQDLRDEIDRLKSLKQQTLERPTNPKQGVQP